MCPTSGPAPIASVASARHRAMCIERDASNAAQVKKFTALWSDNGKEWTPFTAPGVRPRDESERQREKESD